MASRLAPVRRRVRVARASLVAVGALLFVGTAGLARTHLAGHRKQGVTPLAAPGGFVAVVRRDQLAAGILAPAEAPPGVESAPS
jgi:hypothetical protein